MEESFEGTQVVKGTKAYILKEKFASFEMKDDESVQRCFIGSKCLSMISKHLVRK